MADMCNSERLRGFGNGQTDRWTFAILELLSRLKSLMLSSIVILLVYALGVI